MSSFEVECANRSSHSSGENVPLQRPPLLVPSWSYHFIMNFMRFLCFRLIFHQDNNHGLFVITDLRLVLVQYYCFYRKLPFSTSLYRGQNSKVNTVSSKANYQIIDNPVGLSKIFSPFAIFYTIRQVKLKH